MRKLKLIGLAALLLSACEMQSYGDFESQPFEEQIVLRDQYQDVYRRVLKGARMCWGSGLVPGAPTTVQTEANLFSDLNYAEVFYYSSGLVYTPTALVRISKAKSGTLVQVKTGPIGGKKHVRRLPLNWARGHFSCKA